MTAAIETAAVASMTGLWQGAAVAAGLALCLRLVPRTRAAERHGLWLAAFALAAALPLWPMLAVQRAATTVQAAGAARAAWFEMDARWALAVMAAWGLLALVRLTMLGLGAARARRIWREAEPIAIEKTRLRGRARVEICRSAAVDRPSVIGFFRPRILIPDWLEEKLTAGERRQLVLHEMEHLRRLDDWTNLATKLSVAVLPLNLGLWWMEARLEREREMACDEGVVRRTGERRAYAACLASVAERRLERRLGMRAALELGAWHRRPELAERILSLLHGRERLCPAARAAASAGICGSLLLAGLALTRCPQMVGFVTPARVMAAAPSAASKAVAKVEKSPVQVVTQRTAVRRGAASAVAPAEERAEIAIPVLAQMDSAPQKSETAQMAGARSWVILTMVWPQLHGEETVAEDDREPGAVQGDKALGEKTAGKTAQQGAERIPVAPAPAGWLIWEL